ncbi:MAG: hypothetical protein JWO67_6303 [Streptosporangiaceae bacterium]|nr:hypothetical protein [Streptosporangiaceae bacterium]
MATESRVPGPPGLAYEATWGRKTARSRTFIGRVYEVVEGGGMQLFACDHQHPDQASAHDCARAEAEAVARRAAAAAAGLPDGEAMRRAIAESLPGISRIMFVGDDGTAQEVRLA